MSTQQIGVQMMMLKDHVAENGVYDTMKSLYDLGYQAVEVSQIPMTEENVQELKRASEDFNIKIAALSAAVEPMLPGMPGETLAADFDKIVQDCKTLNCEYLRIGMMPLASMESKEKIMNFIEKAEHYAAQLEAHNIKLYYHTHHIEFQKFDGKYLLDLIKENTEKLGFELDVHWIQRAGEDPVEIIRQYAGRISLLHLKDYRIGSLDSSALDGGDIQAFFQAFTNLIEFAELGTGNLDLPAIIEAGKEAGVEYFLVEQDDTYGVNPLQSLEISAEYLKRAGYSEMF